MPDRRGEDAFTASVQTLATPADLPMSLNDKGVGIVTFFGKTFGGLSRRYYVRQIMFGLVVAGFMFWLKTALRPPTAGLMILLTVNTLLYPYARFVWESIVGFVFGEHVFLVPAPILLFAKLATMFLCWQMAMLIAPVGLAWLYWHHSRRRAAHDA